MGHLSPACPFPPATAKRAPPTHATTTGQILRMLGLLIEMIGIGGLALWSGTDEAGNPRPGFFSSRGAWVLVCAGFLIWLVGTVTTYWHRRGPKSQAASGKRIDDLSL